jgi:hypothetical protein
MDLEQHRHYLPLGQSCLPHRLTREFDFHQLLFINVINELLFVLRNCFRHYCRGLYFSLKQYLLLPLSKNGISPLSRHVIFRLLSCPFALILFYFASILHLFYPFTSHFLFFFPLSTFFFTFTPFFSSPFYISPPNVGGGGVSNI